MKITRKIIKVLILAAFFAVAFNLSVTINPSVQASKAPNAQRTMSQISLKMTSASAYKYGDNTSVTNVLTHKDQHGNWMFRLYDIFKGFTNIFLFIGLLVFAFANILHINIDTYAIKKLLPKLIAVVLMINLALPIITIFSTLVDRVQTISIFNSYKGIIGHSLPFYSQIESVWDNFSWWDGIKLSLSTLLAIPAMIVVLLISVFVQAGVTLMLALRPTIIYLATAVAPLAIACALLPQTETFFKRWLKIIAFWMVYPLIVSVFAYVISLLPSLTYSQGFIGATLTVSIPLIIKIGFLWFLLRMPFTWEKDVGGIIASIPGSVVKGGAAVAGATLLTAGALSARRDLAKGKILGKIQDAGSLVKDFDTLQDPNASARSKNVARLRLLKDAAIRDMLKPGSAHNPTGLSAEQLKRTPYNSLNADARLAADNQLAQHEGDLKGGGAYFLTRAGFNPGGNPVQRYKNYGGFWNAAGSYMIKGVQKDASGQWEAKDTFWGSTALGKGKGIGLIGIMANLAALGQYRQNASAFNTIEGQKALKKYGQGWAMPGASSFNGGRESGADDLKNVYDQPGIVEQNPVVWEKMLANLEKISGKPRDSGGFSKALYETIRYLGAKNSTAKTLTHSLFKGLSQREIGSGMEQLKKTLQISSRTNIVDEARATARMHNNLGLGPPVIEPPSRGRPQQRPGRPSGDPVGNLPGPGNPDYIQGQNVDAITAKLQKVVDSNLTLAEKIGVASKIAGSGGELNFGRFDQIQSSIRHQLASIGRTDVASTLSSTSPLSVRELVAKEVDARVKDLLRQYEAAGIGRVGAALSTPDASQISRYVKAIVSRTGGSQQGLSELTEAINKLAERQAGLSSTPEDLTSALGKLNAVLGRSGSTMELNNNEVDGLLNALKVLKR